MKRFKIIIIHSVQCLMVFFIYYVTAHCSYSAPVNICQLFEEAAVTDLTSASDPNMEKVFEDPGIIAVYHGFGCAKSNKSGKQDILRVVQKRDVGRYTDATVFLNGWHSKYLDDDQNVAALGTIIRNIEKEGEVLKWETVGVLSDDNFDNPYEWCYHFTVVAWNRTRIDLFVDHKDGDCESHNPSEVNYFFAENKGTSTALSSFPTILQNTIFENSKTVTILPRGFGFKWGYDSFSDHNLLQIGYNMEHSEIFNEKSKHYDKGYKGTTTSGEDFSFVNTGYVSWETYAIFKDNKGRRNYEFGEMVSELGGNDLGVIQPPFFILPTEDEGFFSGCGTVQGSLRTVEFEIDDIPYEYAIPMLTGWELDYLCDDNDVKEIGMWIDKWSYQKDPAASTGKLHYTLSSVLLDNDGSPDFFFRHKVTVLGIKPLPVSVKASKSE